MPIELTVRDTDTGDQDQCVIGEGPGGYVVTCGPGCYLASEQVHANGTVQLTIKPVPDDGHPLAGGADDRIEATCDPVDGVRHAIDPTRCPGDCRRCTGCARCLAPAT